MASQLILFLDDGGVMNDNFLRGRQWQRLIGDFFVPLLGGTHDAWSKANRSVADGLFDLDNWKERIRAAPDYVSFDRTYQLDWLRGMCELVDVAGPADDEECVELAHRAGTYIIYRVHADFPGATEAIRTLHRQGYTLHTASGEASTELAGYLQGMGVCDCFGRLYGPDLIDTFKAGPKYYERIFQDAAISPSEAIIVDDSPLALEWAAQVGAQTVLVGSDPKLETAVTYQIESLAELPELLQSTK